MADVAAFLPPTSQYSSSDDDYYDIRVAATEIRLASSDEQVPTIVNFSPADGSTITSDDYITFDTLDDHSLRLTNVNVTHGDGTSEPIFDGYGFLYPYSASSTRTVITGGYRFTIYRTGGWPESTLMLRIDVVDAAGFQASSYNQYNLNVSNPTNAVYYLMRGRDPDCGPLTFRYWVVFGSPDTTGAQYTGTRCGATPLSNITVAHSWEP